MTDFSAIYSWYLWKRKVTDASVRVLHISDMPRFGFSSVYGVDEATAGVLNSNEETAGFKGIVYSDYLYVDCDTEGASHNVETGLRAAGIGFKKYTTGNRGAHYAIRRVATPSQLLPLMDKAWVKARFPDADLKLYSHLHLFRVEGAVHEKTGRKKELVEVCEGTSISLQELSLGEGRVHSSLSDQDRVTDPSSIFDDEKVMRWSTPQENGKRHEFLMKLALRFAERGEESSFAFRWMQHVSALYTEPKSDEEIQKLLNWAYEVKS